MSRSDSEAIVRNVNQVNPGHARYLQIEGMAPDFTIGGKFDNELLPTILNWMKELGLENNSSSFIGAVQFSALLYLDTLHEILCLQ